MSNFTLHPVTTANSAATLPEVLRLIRALAEFEKEPLSSVKATEESLKRNIIENEYARCTLVYDGEKPEGKAVAMAVYFFSFSTWTGKGGLYLEDLYVDEPYRGKGIARILFRHLAQICKEKDLARMEWVVLDWNEPAKKVYEKMGAIEGKGWERMRVDGDALDKLAQ